MKRHKAQKAKKKKGEHPPPFFSLPMPFAQQDDVPAHETSSPEPPVGNMEQPLGTLTYDDGHFVYEGFALDLEKAGEVYIPVTHLFSAEEAGVVVEQDENNLASLLDRLCAMLDLVGRDRQRQMEILRFGARIWHSPYRPESLASQALDYAFYHNTLIVASLLPFVERYYQEAEVEVVDTWTSELQSAYHRYRGPERDSSLLWLVLARQGIPARVVTRFSYSQNDYTCTALQVGDVMASLLFRFRAYLARAHSPKHFI